MKLHRDKAAAALDRPDPSCRFYLFSGADNASSRLFAQRLLTALTAECAPEAYRGRYLSVVQLAWNVSSGVAPLVYTALLDGGALAAWAGPVLLCGLWALCVLRLRAVLPRAATRVTNAAEDVPAAA